VTVAVYTRVSTNRQELEQQIAACVRYCEFKHLVVGRLFSDIMSGTKSARPQYQEMLREMRAGKYDGLVIFRLDRLGRNSRELIMLVDELETRGIAIYSLNENLDTTTPIGKAVRDILLILAQLERDQISEATKQRLQSLKNMGKKLGRKPVQVDADKLAGLASSGASVREVARALNVSTGKACGLLQSVQQTGYEKAPEPAPLSPLTVQ